MKSLLPFLAFTCFFAGSNKVLAQNEPAKPVPQYYLVLYTTGESWDTTKQYHEQKYFNEHSKHVSQMRKNKTIVTGGRYSDTGMIVLEAKNEEEARKMVNADPAVQSKLFKAEVFLFEIFYSGCLQETP